MRNLSLLIPGLSAMPPEQDTPAPQPPAVLTLLARARLRRMDAGADDALLRLFAYSPAPDTDAPAAALSRLGEAESRVMDGYWLRADPVSLRADQARLLLFGPRLLTVRLDEAQTLAAAFNALYDADGWRLETPHPQRWYLRLPDDPRIRTHALLSVIGRNIDGCLPQGVNGKRWRGVLNEVQMLFHDNPVNVAREARELLPINSVWFWGGGYLPAVKPQPWTQLCSADPYARGLAVAAGVAVATAQDITAAWVGESAVIEQLIMVSDLEEAVAYSDAEAWRASLLQLEREWFEPALAALKAGRLDALRLYPGDNTVYELTRADLRCFWRRRRRLEKYLSGK